MKVDALLFWIYSNNIKLIVYGTYINLVNVRVLKRHAKKLGCGIEILNIECGWKVSGPTLRLQYNRGKGISYRIQRDWLGHRVVHYLIAGRTSLVWTATSWISPIIVPFSSSDLRLKWSSFVYRVISEYGVLVYRDNEHIREDSTVGCYSLHLPWSRFRNWLDAFPSYTVCSTRYSVLLLMWVNLFSLFYSSILK
jgi:hypothetical protein